MSTVDADITGIDLSWRGVLDRHARGAREALSERSLFAEQHAAAIAAGRPRRVVNEIGELVDNAQFRYDADRRSLEVAIRRNNPGAAEAKIQAAVDHVLSAVDFTPRFRRV